MTIDANPPCKPDVLLAATFFLMTQYTLQGRPVIAQAVVDHLEKLMNFENGLPPRLVLALPRLREQWLSHFVNEGRMEMQSARTGVVIPFRRSVPD